ncbi:TolC family protein [Magnetococcus sp. PR-3]|uniref:TolC family protein n=1 Tax=Magnetococcus sp. PR-3 TaxID=3120355 RepID=UPI002FCE2E7C
MTKAKGIVPFSLLATVALFGSPSLVMAKQPVTEVYCVQAFSTQSLSVLQERLQQRKYPTFNYSVLEKKGQNNRHWFTLQAGCLVSYQAAKQLAADYAVTSGQSPLVVEVNVDNYALYQSRWNSRLASLKHVDGVVETPSWSHLVKESVSMPAPKAMMVAQAGQVSVSDMASDQAFHPDPPEMEKGPTLIQLDTQSKLANDIPAPAPKPSKQGTGLVMELQIPYLVGQIVAHNVQVQMSRLDQGVAKLAIVQARSIFEGSVSSTASLGNTVNPNTNEQKASRNNRDEYRNYGANYTLGVEKTLSTGMLVELKADLNRTNNNILEPEAREVEYEFTSGVSITQPLLKGRGKDATMVDIRFAQEDVKISVQEFRRILMDQIYQGLLSYWDLYQAQQILDRRGKSVSIVEKLLADDQKRLDLGKGQESTVLETEAILANRQATLELAEQGVWEAVNALRTKLVMFPHVNKAKLVVSSAIGDYQLPAQNQLERLKEAFMARPEYLSQKNRIEQEGIRLAYAKDQQLPQVDIEASFERSGIDRRYYRAFHEAFTENYKDWSVGVNFSMPLGGNNAAKSAVQSQIHKKRRALFALKEIEVTIATSINSALHGIEHAEARLNKLKKAEQINQKLYDLEKKRLKIGQSNSRKVLEREENLNTAQQATLEARVALEKAMIKLQLVEGSLLQAYNQELI